MDKHIGTRLALAAIGMVALAACGTDEFTPQKAQPLIDLPLAEGASATVVATTAERRLVLYQSNVDGAVQFCAEPSPDAIESLASLFSAAGSFGSSTPSGPSTEASASFSNALTTAVSSAFNRSQGIQFFRDGVFALCQAAMNGWIETPASGRSAGAFEADLVKRDVVASENDRGEPIQKEVAIERTIEAPDLNTLNTNVQAFLAKEANKEFVVEGVRDLSEFEVALKFLRKDAKEIIEKEAETGSLLPVSASTGSPEDQAKSLAARLAAVQKFQQLLNPNKPAPAVVNITLEGEFDGEVSVAVDGGKPTKVTSKSFVIDDLSPGLRKIKLSALRGGKPVSREVVEDLKSGLQSKTYTLVPDLKSS